MLPTTKEFWGGKSFRQDGLGIDIVHDAVYIPSSTKVFLDRDTDWGVYTSGGDLIPFGAYERFHTRELVGHGRHIDLSRFDIVDAPYETMVYGGPIIAHYGHFILTSLARLWARRGDAPLLFHSHPPLFDHGAPYIRQFMAAADITPTNSASIERPVRIRNLIVPEPSLIEQNYVTAAYKNTMRQVGENFRPQRTEFSGKKIYLSKSNLGAGVARLANEEVIDEAFRHAGFQVVFPEQLSISDQVSMFEFADVVAGTVSSGFHTLALALDTTCRRIVFEYERAMNANFALLDSLAGGSSVYYSLADRISRMNHPHFLAWYEVGDINALAAEMVEAAVDASRITRQRVMEKSRGDYVTFVDGEGVRQTVLPLGLPESALSQFEVN